jgi:hypothetical protein
MKRLLLGLLLLSSFAFGADKKISDLPSLTEPSWATNDLFAIVDTSAGATKKTTVGDFDLRYISTASTLGDILYGGSGGTFSILGGNTSATTKYLSQTGTGGVSAAPVWATLPPGLPSGGTVNQILIKQSSTDGDATWNDQPVTSPLTTKGDLFGFSTANARLAVGSDGQIVVADSTQTLGVKWANGGPFGRATTQVINGTTSVTAAMGVIEINAASGNVILNLPAWVANTSWAFKRIDSVEANTVTINANGSDTIDGAASFTIPLQYGSAIISSLSSAKWGTF